MRLSLQVQYAICGIFDLGYNGQGEPIRVREIGERQGIPTRYLEQIFQRLRRAGLVTGKRGPGGGYVLARDPSEVTLRDVVEAVEGPLREVLVRSGESSAQHELPHRPDFLWVGLADRLAEVLAETTLEALCRRAARESVDRAADPAPMYHI